MLEVIRDHIRAHKRLALIPLAVIVFLLLRTILLQKPNTELTYTVKQEDLVDTVQVSGTYTTASQTQVISPTNGVIDKVYVDNKDHVTKGQSLFHVESTATPTQQKTAYANYLAASSLVQADTANLYTLQSSMYSSWKKYTDLSTNGTYQNGDGSPKAENRTLPEFTTAEDNWLAAQANYKNQQSVIAKDQAALSVAKQAYDETQSVTVTAPIAGTVVNFLKKSGDQVVASTATTTSLPVLVIANFAKPYLTTAVSENYVARLSEGQKAVVVFDALKDQRFSARVESIDAVGTINKGIVTFTTRLVVDKLPSTIRPNMTALITIETKRKNNILTIPNSAVVTKNGENFVQDARSRKLTAVQLGIKGVAKTEVITGLTAGRVIVASPNTN